MIGISGQSVHEAISSLRDLSFIIGLVVLGWKGRSWFQPVYEFLVEAKKFITRANRHMVLVEGGMKVLLENHLHHIQSDAAQIRDALVKQSTQGNSDASSQ